MICLKSVTKKYGTKIGVKDISFTLADGEKVGILGPSGCGKTTTLRLIAGLEKPDGGEIHINQRLVSSPRKVVDPHKRSVGMVFQGLALWPHLTVKENIGFGLDGTILTQREREGEIKHILEVVQLAVSEKAYPAELSEGERQRVALARTLVLRPRILLLDEPLANLDLLLKREIFKTLLKMQREFKFTLLYVTHNQDEMAHFPKNIIILNEGRVEQIGSLSELLSQPSTDFVERFVSKSLFTSFSPTPII